MKLQRVDVAPESLEIYEELLGREAIGALREAASPLCGARVAHVNATSYGGGVSELLRSLVPLYRALGVDADWLVIPGRDGFFEITKGIHNALQGGEFDLTQEARREYLAHNEAIAQGLADQYDIVVVHDPQPAALRTFATSRATRWVWRCHIDSSSPNPDVLDFLTPHIAAYDAAVFTMVEFVPPPWRDLRVVVIPPAIDPLSPKNLTIPSELARRIVRWSGVSIDRPFITQVSRFDPWKDPFGVIEVYRAAREEVCGLQLALLGQMANDDPEGWTMYRDIVEQTEADEQIHVLTNFTGIGNLEVNAFQSASDVVLQKSIREGFGLVVSESLWKGTPVVAGRAGGIPMQMPPGVGGYLVDSVEECAARTVELLRDPRAAQALGASGREHVRAHFLVSRLLTDELCLLDSLLASPNDQ